jgi:hypothetical protein
MSSLKVCYRKNGEHCTAIKNNILLCPPKKGKEHEDIFI